MAPLGKRAGDSQGQSSVKRQRFIDDFLAGTLRGAVDASSDEEAPDEEVRGAPAPGKVEDHANAAGQLVETPKARLTPEPSSRKALTLPLRETPSRPLAEGQPRAQGRGPTPARIAIEIPTPSASQSAGRQTRRNATTDSTPQSQSRTPASRSLFQMWGQSPSVPAPTASPAVKTHPKSSDVEMGGLSEEGEAPEPKRRARQPARRTSGVRGAARGRQSTLNGVSVDESEADDEGWTKQNKNKMISELPPEVLRGLFTSLPGVKPKPGLNRKLPPLSTIEDIFDDLAKKAMRLGFEKFLDHLQARELKVATMFSGTESPLLALDMLKTSLQRVFGRTFKLHHMFSAEIEPFKQSYIQRNFSPELIFRDVNELVAEKAITAFGSEREVPTDIDLLVIGFPCVDFSNLNLHKKDIEGQGESGHTFFGVMRYCTRAKPPLIVVENVCSAPWDKLVTYWERIGYTAFHTKVDTKNYYLPQTRERGYMICVYTDILKDRKRRTADGPTLTQFSKMMKAFERPASSPITHFMLKETDPRFRIAVDDISSAPIKDRQAVDWTRYKARHLAYRMKEKLGDKRPLTKWTDNGACYPPDFYWRRWMQGQTQRVWDTLDSNYLRAFIRGYDMNFKSRFIDLSQGIDRELDTRAYGVAGCLTPRGQAFITSRGGPLLGIEALALQGIPIDKLLLSSESQRDLGDLAGNAMSSTVVGSAICCVLILYYHVLEQGSAVQAESEKAPEKEVPSVLEDQTMLVLPPKLTDDEKMSTIELHKAARRSAKICACESQSTTPNWHLFKCSKCEHTACSECGSNPPHQYVSLPREQITDRWMEFENHLQEVLPMRFEVQGLDRAMWDDLRPADMPTQAARSWDQFAAVLDEALSDELRFHSIARQTAWTVIYEGTHTRLELVFSQARVQWLLFVKSPATEPSNSPLRQILAQPIASMVPWDDDVLSGLWFVHSPVSSSFEIAIEGKGDTVPSYPAVLGLQHPTFKDTKVYSQITITATDAEMQNLEFDIRGDYELLQGCGAANGSLHKRIPTRSGELPLYFFLDPTEIGEADFDSWVFSLDHERLDTRQTRLTVAETMPGFSGITSQDFQVPVRCWSKKREACPDVRLATSAAVPTYQYPAQDIHVHGSTCKGSYVPFWVSAVPATRAESDFKADELQVADLAESPQMLQRFSWLLQRASTMTHFEDWVSVAVTPEMEQQCCALCSPQKPRILWTLGDKDQVQPYENPEDAAEYEQNIKQRPAPFLGYAKVDANGQLSLRICLNIVTLLHRARGKLCEGEGLTLQWRVCIDQMGFLHPRLNQLKEKSNDDDAESAQPPHFTRYFLRKEQLRSLTWMIAQESDDVEPFEEEEVAEALLPSINWRAEARATTKKYVRGGILGDEVGYGKTAISLALFDAQHEKDCREDRAKAVGAIPVKATLIVVPHHLVDQWRNEIQKFLGSTYRVLEIKNINSLANLSIRDMQNAHLVLVSATLFKGDKYYEKVSLFASPPGEPRGDGRIFTEWLKDAMEGIRAHVSCLMDEGADAVLDRIHDRTEELAASDIYRKYQPSKRLKGAKLQEYLENLREERRRNGGEEVDNYTAVQKIIEARKAREKEAARGTSEKHASRRDAVATRSSAAVKVKSEDEQQDGGAQRLERDTTAASAATQEVHHLEHGATDVVVSGVKNTDESSESAEPLPATTTAGSESVKNADSIGSVTKAEDTDDMDEAPRSRPVRARSVTHYVVSDDSEDEVKPPRRPARTSARNARRPSARSTRRAPVRRRAAREDESDEWVGSQDSSDDDDDFVDDMEAEESPQSEDDDDFSDSSIISSRPRKQKARQKRRKSPSSESDTPVKPKKAPAKRPAKKIVVKGIPTGDQVRSEARRAFSFNLAARDWRNLKNPLLHMFEFNRIIIDEFTYSKDRNFTATLAIPARKKWILSGTPPLNDFADVKSFSPFLDVALGEDDEDTSNRPENERLRVMQRERTDAEQFRPFVTRHSAAWHSRRHDVAQGFLDKFMRKNIPLFDEIP
ncbi:hypothetical protein KEM52_004868 [Ascosphaera acerosa]|nr:hypothetical protein KEM52_004868 [Ascosphaera acerosa]